MALLKRVSGLLVLAVMFAPAEAINLYSPSLCYILDGFLGLYGLFITGLFIREKFFKTKVKVVEEERIYSGLSGQDGGYDELMMGDGARGRNRRVPEDSTYTGLTKRTDGEYRELPMKKERHRKKEEVYQGLSSATRDTYQSLQMQPLAAH